VGSVSVSLSRGICGGSIPFGVFGSVHYAERGALDALDRLKGKARVLGRSCLLRRALLTFRVRCFSTTGSTEAIVKYLWLEVHSSCGLQGFQAWEDLLNSVTRVLGVCSCGGLWSRTELLFRIQRKCPFRTRLETRTKESIMRASRRVSENPKAE
jgi:hypothetical protein